MKKIGTAMVMMITISCTAQKIPAAVQAGFAKTFPGIAAKWDTEDGNYEANFRKDSKTMSATFDSKGSWLETETDIPVNKLPETVSLYIKSNYANSRINEAALLETPSGNMYEAEVDGKDLLFDMNGKFIKAIKD